MKELILSVAALSAFGLCAATPVVVEDSVVMTQNRNTREVTIAYELAEAPGIVTVDVQTNRGDGVYVSIGRDKLRHVWGDVNQYAAVGAHEIKWQPLNDWPDVRVKLNDGGVKAVVTAWALECPPDFMVVDLEVANTIRFYASELELPEEGGVTNRAYKTTKILMKKVHAGGVTFTEGSPSFESGRTASMETMRYVTLSQDFYLGVYPVTARQWRYFAKLPNNCVCANYGNWEVCPLSGAYNEIRGTWSTYNWPGTKEIDTSTTASYMGWLRNWVGNRFLFDLPTSAQWEFACRAGTTSAFLDGSNDGANIGDYAWYGANCSNYVNGAWVAYDHEVGTKKPNNWGFYDMIGQHEEWVLDRYQNNRQSNPVVDPECENASTTADGGTRMSRGGNYRSALKELRSAYWGGRASAHGNYGGVRLACPARYIAE